MRLYASRFKHSMVVKAQNLQLYREKRKFQQCHHLDLLDRARPQCHSDRMYAAGEALNSLLGNSREPTLREQIEEATTSGESCFSLTNSTQASFYKRKGAFLNHGVQIRLW